MSCGRLRHVKRRMEKLAATMPIGIYSPGVCPMCIAMVAMELEAGDGRTVAGVVTHVAPCLWGEGLDETVRMVLEPFARRGVPDAAEALRDFEERGFRSTIFRAVIRHLADEVHEAAQ